ncbi:ABC transporter permease [Spirochaetia bacterium]|nr:ABC transporter permease [Spirochaetia bacterium]
MIADIMRNLRRNLRFVRMLVKLRLSHMMVFRLSFFGAFFADASLFAVQLLAFSAIYSQVDSIGDWGRGRMLIFIGTFSMINALNMVIFFFGIVEIPDKIREGALDLYLTKPVSPLLRLTFESVNPGSIPLIVLSAVIIIYGLSVEGLAVTAAAVTAYIALTLLMTLLWYDTMLIIRTIPFFVIAGDSIGWFEGIMFELNMKIPGVLYKGVFKLLFYFVLPYGIMATVPTQLLTGVLSLPALIHALCIVAFFTVFTIWFWRLGVRHYKSPSS